MDAETHTTCSLQTQFCNIIRYVCRNKRTFWQNKRSKNKSERNMKMKMKMKTKNGRKEEWETKKRRERKLEKMKIWHLGFEVFTAKKFDENTNLPRKKNTWGKTKQLVRRQSIEGETYRKISLFLFWTFSNTFLRNMWIVNTFFL